MQRVPDEYEADYVVEVHPDSAQPEPASIGHGMVSHTVMPHVIQDPNEAARVYVDCPGFFDNRGSEINIANAINIRQILQQVRSVKTVFLLNYKSLLTGRIDGVQYLERMCQQLFGGVEHLRNHQNSILLGGNCAPAQRSIASMRAQILQINSPTTQILAQRAFLYDPLERGGTDFWSRERFQRSRRCRLFHSKWLEICFRQY
jgi:hypothetical protein